MLIGAGHSHVQVLRRFGMRPVPGVRITLVAREVHTPYSGMLPGHVAGFYEFDDIHIDLAPLCRFAGARLISGEVNGLDPDGGIAHLVDHPSLRFDLASINTGGRPDDGGAQLTDAVVPVKPIGRFLPAWSAFLDRVTASRAPSRVAFVGGGAGGVELTLAAACKLGAVAPEVRIALVHEGTLLPGHGQRARARLERALIAHGVELFAGARVTSVANGALSSAEGSITTADDVFWVTGVGAPAWPGESGLAVDDNGFVRVDRHLRSRSHANVFAAGDVASLTQARPKSGVFAVREGPVLHRNLRRALTGRALVAFRPQRRALSLISEGRRSAVASRGGFYAAGPWVWRWKDRIDRRFMRRFRDLPEMAVDAPLLPRGIEGELPEAMRCGGCGSKLGADLLTGVLGRLALPVSPAVCLGVGDDAAVLAPLTGPVVVTVDSFRSMVDDPYVLGRIAAHHALNDVFAMGAKPIAALALVTVPLMGRPQMEEDLYLVMRGAVNVLDAEGVALAGGHSSEGSELNVGFSITGVLSELPLGKRGLAAGQALVLTRPLGTGVLFAAAMRGRARSRWLEAAIAAMLESNASAATVLRAHGATACTDVTGFGLLGHLTEMTRASDVRVRVDVDQVPFHQGALECAGQGIESSLMASNALTLADFDLDGCDRSAPDVALLLDPQTAGGLLAGVPADRAAACVRALRAEGHGAARIGCVLGSGHERHRLVR